jgi:hypothetical protein
MSKKSICYGLFIGTSCGLYGSYRYQIYKNRIPDYDFTVRERYDQFADLDMEDEDQEKYGTEKAMSLTAFIKSIISPKPNLPVWVAHPRVDGVLVSEKALGEEKGLIELIKTVDENSDEIIHYDEYLFFSNLLSAKLGSMKVVFKLFDDKLTNEQICKVLRVNEKFKTFFPPESKYSQFAAQQKYLKDLVLKQEFKQHDVEGKELISVEAFSELITHSIHFNSIGGLGGFKQKLNILKTNGYFAPTGKVDFDTFKAFHNMQTFSNDIGRLIKIYSDAGKKILKPDFKKAVKLITNVSLDEKVVDLVYALFETDGTLNYQQFIQTLNEKKGNE